jgi:hypothetical protein
VLDPRERLAIERGLARFDREGQVAPAGATERGPAVERSAR